MTMAVLDFSAIKARMERRPVVAATEASCVSRFANHSNFQGDHPSTWNLPAFQPTRVSAVRTDPGYIQFCSLRARREQVDVFLDGVLQDYAVTADAEEGWVLRNMVDARGQLCRMNNEIARETVHGKVELKTRPDWV